MTHQLKRPEGQLKGGATVPAAGRRLDGGYLELRTVELCMAWGLLLAGDLRLVDVRVWLAVLEMRQRRRRSKADRSPHYTLDELRRLVGGGGGSLKASLRRLKSTNLVTWSEATPEVSTSPDQLTTANLEAVWGMYDAMPPKRRRIPVPRRVLRLLAGGVNRGVMATALGQLATCLFYHRGEGWRPTGSCKGSWIADAFGLSTRSVIRAREHLEGLGWLRRRESPGQWHLNKYGATYEVNLSWARTAGELEATLEQQRLSTTRMSPPEARNGTRMSPPREDQNLSTRRVNNQNPACGGGAGSSLKKGGRTKPTLRDITHDDLTSIDRLMVLFEEAEQGGLVDDTYMDRLNFAALAEHCRVRGTSNPAGMFARLLRWTKTPEGGSRAPAPAWHFITDGDEDAVRTKVSSFLYKDPIEERPKYAGDEDGGEPFGLSSIGNLCASFA